MAHPQPTPCQVNKWNCQMFIKKKKKKISVSNMIRLFKNNLLSNSHKKPVLSKFTSMQELEIKNWIIFEKYETILTLSES